MSPIKRMTSAFSSAGDRSSRVRGGDMPLQNLKSLYAESPDLPIFTRAVSPCPPTAAASKTSAAQTFAPITQGYSNPLKRLDTSESVNLHKCLILLDSCQIHATRWRGVLARVADFEVERTRPVNGGGAMSGHPRQYGGGQFGRVAMISAVRGGAHPIVEHA